MNGAGAPVERAARIVSLDVLRGIAVLGILVMNIIAFALPDIAYTNPLRSGGFSGADRIAWWFSYLFFELKFMTLFSMLFGAGLILLVDRLEARGVRAGSVHFRRVGWLAVFGLAHGYLLWWGDILFAYAVCGAAIYPLRRLSPRRLILIGSSLVLLTILTLVGAGHYMESQADQVAELRGRLDQGQVVEDWDEDEQALWVQWEEQRKEFDPNPIEVAAQIKAYRGGYFENLLHRAPKVFFMQTVLVLSYLLWRAGGVMLIGMALMKLGVLHATRSLAHYLAWTAIGYGVGLPLVILGGQSMIAADFAFPEVLKEAMQFNQIGSLLVAGGHLGLIMLFVRSGALAWFQRRLAAVGQMALTSYLVHTLICTTIFYGYGLGLFNHFSRADLLVFAAAIWIAQLIASEPWLRTFRFGPFEWLWRSLTYGERQPLRRRSGR